MNIKPLYLVSAVILLAAGAILIFRPDYRESVLQSMGFGKDKPVAAESEDETPAPGATPQATTRIQTPAPKSTVVAKATTPAPKPGATPIRSSTPASSPKAAATPNGKPTATPDNWMLHPNTRLKPAHIEMKNPDDKKK